VEQKQMDLIDKLKSAHSFHGDPLHREAWEEIERLEEVIAKITLMASNLWNIGADALMNEETDEERDQIDRRQDHEEPDQWEEE
jgi:hypothetical protein